MTTRKIAALVGLGVMLGASVVGAKQVSTPAAPAPRMVITPGDKGAGLYFIKDTQSGACWLGATGTLGSFTVIIAAPGNACQ